MLTLLQSNFSKSKKQICLSEEVFTPLGWAPVGMFSNRVVPIASLKVPSFFLKRNTTTPSLSRDLRIAGSTGSNVIVLRVNLILVLSIHR